MCWPTIKKECSFNSFQTKNGFIKLQYGTPLMNKWKSWINNPANIYLTVSSCHVMYTFQGESTFYSCLNVKEFFSRSKCEIWRWSDCNCTPTQNHLVLKWTLNYLAKLAKWLSCVLSTSLYGAFDCMLLSCHVRVSEWIHTL